MCRVLQTHLWRQAKQNGHIQLPFLSLTLRSNWPAGGRWRARRGLRRFTDIAGFTHACGTLSQAADRCSASYWNDRYCVCARWDVAKSSAMHHMYCRARASRQTSHRRVVARGSGCLSVPGALNRQPRAWIDAHWRSCRASSSEISAAVATLITIPTATPSTLPHVLSQRTSGTAL